MNTFRVNSFELNEVPIANMVGKVFTKVYGEIGSTELIFENAEERFVFFHEQDCCEQVDINDIVGDLQDLIGEPLLVAEEVTGEIPASFNEDDYYSVTWTFYKFATRKGYVDIRWLGESNGWYSEHVTLRWESV